MKIFCFILLLLVSGAQAQLNTITREYVPITHQLSKAPLFGMNLENWTAFAYNAQNNEWRAVPFQFDQLNENGHYETSPPDTANANDELCMLPEDLGDRAPASIWLDDDATQQLPRLELEFVDPLNPDQKGWVYLYQNVSNVPIIPSFLSYIPGPEGTPAADTIVTAAYTLGHDQNGWMDYLSLASNKSKNLVDRFKLRLAGSSSLVGGEYEINETWVEASTSEDAVKFYKGSVRAFHEIDASILLEKLNLILLPDRADFSYHFQYFPYSFQIAAETDLDPGLIALFGVKLIRQSLDLNQNAIGMQMYSPRNREGIFIDGLPDDVNLAIEPGNEQNWLMASGPQGTILIVFEISSIEKSNKQLYYYDNENGSTADGTEDTGILGSYGDMGILIQATGSAFKTRDKLTVNYKGYFIDRPNTNVTFGEQIMAWENHPLQLNATEQFYEPSWVDHDDTLHPETFELRPAYPNPFNPVKQAHTRIEFRGEPSHMYDMVIYNILGQHVAQFQNMQSSHGSHTIQWDGRNEQGAPINPGIYFYSVSNGSETFTKKLIVQH
mgnify:CR=1 FL=1